MREQLIQYVNLLFAGNSGVEEIREEILQNTLDRYDDLVSQGKTPESAYRLAISGIGDINEIINEGQAAMTSRAPSYSLPAPLPEVSSQQQEKNRRMRAFAIGMYIMSIIPLIVLDRIGQAEIGLCMTLILVAAATVIMIVYRDPSKADRDEDEEAPMDASPNSELKRSIQKLISTLGLVAYFLLSFTTGAWYITWLVFPITAAVNGLVKACIDLWEVSKL